MVNLFAAMFDSTKTISFPYISTPTDENTNKTINEYSKYIIIYLIYSRK